MTPGLRKNVFPKLLAGALAASLAACGGDSRSASLPQPAPTSTSAAAPYTGPLADAAFRITIPGSRSASTSRRPHYISAATASVTITLNSPPAGFVQPGTFALTPGSTNGTSNVACPASTGGYTCIIPIKIPPGSDSLTVTTKDASNNVLSQQTATFTIAAGQSNTPSIVLDANTGSITVTPPGTVAVSGANCSGGVVTGSSDVSAGCTATFSSSAAQSFTLSAADPSGVAIPSGAPGPPAFSAISSDTSRYTVSVVGSTLTVTPVAAGFGTAKITVTATPASASDGLSSVALAFAVSGQRVYVSNSGASSVALFDANPTGTVASAPVATISGASTQLSVPLGIAFDQSRRIYVTDFNSNAVTVYAATPNGTAAGAPLATIQGTNTGVNGPNGVALDSLGRVYVTNYNASTVAVFAAVPANANGTSLNNAPLTTTTVAAPNGIALDSSDEVYVTSAPGGGPDSVFVFAAYPSNSPASFPSAVATISGPTTTLNSPEGVALDSSGKIYVANYGSPAITVFAAGANGDAAPGATIQGAATNLSGPFGVAVDRNDEIYVVNRGPNTVTVYAAHPIGPTNSAPIATIGGGSTGLNSPVGVAVH